MGFSGALSVTYRTSVALLNQALRASSGFTDGDNCSGGGLYVVNYNNPVTFADHTDVFIVKNAGQPGAESLPAASLTASAAQQIEYTEPPWIVALLAGDKAQLSIGAGSNYTDGPLADSFTSSIYQGAKDATTTEQFENLATGVTGVEIVNPAGGIVTITIDGIALMPTVAASETRLYQVNGSVIGYLRDVPATIQIGQGKFIPMGTPIEAQVFTLTNCLSPNYVTDSIYSGTKSITAIWQTERQATGVNALLIKAGDQDVNIGWGDTALEASATKQTVLAGVAVVIDITGTHIGWQGAIVGTVTIEQGKNNG